jgi:hypothetical protein
LKKQQTKVERQFKELEQSVLGLDTGPRTAPPEKPAVKAARADRAHLLEAQIKEYADRVALQAAKVRALRKEMDQAQREASDRNATEAAMEAYRAQQAQSEWERIENERLQQEADDDASSRGRDMTAPMTTQAPLPGQAGPPALLQPPVMPWTPFTPMPTDEDPLIAAMRKRKLAKMIDSAKFEGMPPEWQQVAFLEYGRMDQVIVAAQPAQPLPKGVAVVAKADSPESLAAEEQAAVSPQRAQPSQGAPNAPRQ